MCAVLICIGLQTSSTWSVLQESALQMLSFLALRKYFFFFFLLVLSRSNVCLGRYMRCMRLECVCVWCAYLWGLYVVGLSWILRLDANILTRRKQALFALLALLSFISLSNKWMCCPWAVYIDLNLKIYFLSCCIHAWPRNSIVIKRIPLNK